MEVFKGYGVNFSEGQVISSMLIAKQLTSTPFMERILCSNAVSILFDLGSR